MFSLGCVCSGLVLHKSNTLILSEAAVTAELVIMIWKARSTFRSMCQWRLCAVVSLHATFCFSEVRSSCVPQIADTSDIICSEDSDLQPALTRFITTVVLISSFFIFCKRSMKMWLMYFYWCFFNDKTQAQHSHNMVSPIRVVTVCIHNQSIEGSVRILRSVWTRSVNSSSVNPFSKCWGNFSLM